MILRRVEQIGSREQSREIFCGLDAVQQHGSSDFVHDKAARQQGWVTLSARALGSVGSLAGLNFSVGGFAAGGAGCSSRKMNVPSRTTAGTARPCQGDELSCLRRTFLQTST